MPAADARIVQPPWVVVRWSLFGDCKIWRNDVNAPWGPGWQTAGSEKNPVIAGLEPNRPASG